MSFTEFLKKRDRKMFEAMTDIGLNLSDPKTKDAFISQLQKSKVDLKKITANINANPDSKPDKQQVQVDKQFQNQQDMLAGKTTPAGVKQQDWQKSVSLLTPTGKAIPNQIGKGTPLDIAGTLEKGAAQGALPANVNKFVPSWLKMKQVKPPLNSASPDIDPNQKMSPSDLAKSKNSPSPTQGS